MPARTFTVLFLLYGVLLNGQQVRFYASTDASLKDQAGNQYEVLQNSVFQVSFTLENADGSSFTAPVFQGMEIIQGPSTSTQVSIINGRRSEKITFSYSLTGNTPGTYVIGPARITTSQGDLSTRPLTITIIKTSETAVQQNLTFVEAVASDTMVYIGQQIIIRYQLVTQENIKSYEAVSNFEFDGFFVRELKDISKSTERIIKNGQEYYSTTLEAISLFPQQTGTYTLPSISFRLGIPRPSRRRSLFSFQEYDFKIYNTPPLKITVNDLPPGAPSSFSGAVGHYTAVFEVDKRSLSTDQSLDIKLGIRGDGDSKYVIPPDLKLDENFEVYDPNILRDESFIDKGKVTNYKVFEYLAVPEEPGQYLLFPEFTYFNTDSNRYETIQPDVPFRVTVTRGQGNTSDIASVNNRNLVQNKPSSQLTRPRWKFMGSGLHLSILTMIFLSMVSMGAHKFLEWRELNTDPALRARKKARKTALKRLEKSKFYLENNDTRAFYDEISKTILKYLEDKLNISTGSLTMDNLNSMLYSIGLQQKTIEKITTLLKDTELALYAGISNVTPEKTYQQASMIIEDMETAE